MSTSNVRNTIMNHRDTRFLENKSGRGRKKLLTERVERRLIRMINNDPKITIPPMKANLTAVRVHASMSAITRTLNKGGLKAYRPRKTPLLKRNYLIARLKFATNFMKNVFGTLSCGLTKPNSRCLVRAIGLPIERKEDKPTIRRKAFLQTNMVEAT